MSTSSGAGSALMETLAGPARAAAGAQIPGLGDVGEVTGPRLGVGVLLLEEPVEGRFQKPGHRGAALDRQVANASQRLFRQGQRDVLSFFDVNQCIT